MFPRTIIKGNQTCDAVRRIDGKVQVQCWIEGGKIEKKINEIVLERKKTQRKSLIKTGFTVIADRQLYIVNPT